MKTLLDLHATVFFFSGQMNKWVNHNNSEKKPDSFGLNEFSHDPECRTTMHFSLCSN